MPIFDQGYQHWQGKLSGHAWRWLSITRQGVRTPEQWLGFGVLPSRFANSLLARIACLLAPLRAPSCLRHGISLSDHAARAK